MAFASLLEHVGGMGRFQVVSVLLLSLPVLMMASHNLLQNFTAATSDHWCRPRPEANATGLNPEALLRVWVPHGERCRRFVKPQWWLLEANGSEPNSSWPETEPCSDGWTYNRSVFTSTIVTEWDLVCSSRGLKQLAQSLYMAGVLVGGVFGGLSDRFGRRSVLTWCYLQMAAMGTCSSFAPTFTVYCLFRFLTGMAFSGVVLNSVSLSLEWMPTHMRALVGTFMGYCYTTGQFLLAGVAFAVPDWRRLQLVVSLPFFGFFLYSWWLTESARWLVMVGKSHQALRELQKVARINGKKEEGDKLDIETLRSHMEKEMTLSKTRHTAIDLVRTPVLRRISFCLCFVWFSTSFAYYGLAMDLQNFEVNIYVIQLIFGAVDIPAKLMSILTITYVGRRFTQAIALILAGLAILANVLVPRGEAGGGGSGVPSSPTYPGGPGQAQLVDGTPRAPDSPDSPGRFWERLFGRVLQLRLPLHGGALPHRDPADRHGLGQHHVAAGQHHGPPGEDGGRALPGAALRHLRRRARGVGAGGRLPARDAEHGPARDRGGGGGKDTIPEGRSPTSPGPSPAHPIQQLHRTPIVPPPTSGPPKSTALDAPAR